MGKSMSEVDEILDRIEKITKDLLEAPPGIATHQDILLLRELMHCYFKLNAGVQRGMLKEIREMIDEKN